MNIAVKIIDIPSAIGAAHRTPSIPKQEASKWLMGLRRERCSLKEKTIVVAVFPIAQASELPINI